MDLLDNELIKKYFECEACSPSIHLNSGCPMMALRIIRAMEEPIKKGEYVLTIHNDKEIDEDVAKTEWPYFHPFVLRKPSRFQPAAQGNECKEFAINNGPYCSRCGIHLGDHPKPPTPAEKCALCNSGSPHAYCDRTQPAAKSGEACHCEPKMVYDDCPKHGKPAEDAVDQGINRLLEEWDSRKAHGCLEAEIKALVALARASRSRGGE